MSRFRWPGGNRATAAPLPMTAAEPLPAISAPQALTLQDLVHLRVPMSWQEAVAVMLECLHARPDRMLCPDPTRVTLSARGDVRAVGGAAAPGHPVHAAAALLRDLLGPSNTPTELRATVEQNLADPSRHASLDDFTTALGYFERPGRRGDVAAVYGRGRDLYLKAHAELELARLRARAGRDQGAVSPTVAPPTATKRQRALDATLVVVLVGVIATGALSLFSLAMTPVAPRDTIQRVTPLAPPPDDRTMTSRVARPETPAAAETAAPLAATAMTTDGRQQPISTSGTLPSAASSTPVSTNTPTVVVSDRVAGAPTRPFRETTRASTSAPAGAAPRVTPAATAATATAAPRSLTPRPEPRVDSRPATMPVVEWSVSVRDVTAAMVNQPVPRPEPRSDDSAIPVFSLNNGDVTPAYLVRPQLPSRMTNGVNDPDASTLDLTIDVEGRVERVRLESTRNNINEKMLVAAAKAWIFQPALRNGRPVRYRLRVQLAE